MMLKHRFVCLRLISLYPHLHNPRLNSTGFKLSSWRVSKVTVGIWGNEKGVVEGSRPRERGSRSSRKWIKTLNHSITSEMHCATETDEVWLLSPPAPPSKTTFVLLLSFRYIVNHSAYKQTSRLLCLCVYLLGLNTDTVQDLICGCCGFLHYVRVLYPPLVVFFPNIMSTAVPANGHAAAANAFIIHYSVCLCRRVTGQRLRGMNWPFRFGAY